ncbi:MAG: hypothetical protein E7253_00320 [Lachnospiraceae bacterium]|nr:hypothetical protein [Lachnospiraceae bacterium]
MKFHQAYYTWDWEQLTKYQGGLGIHASSCKNNDFLNHCMKLGARLKSEPANETAELLLYSEELGYVGAFISPREDVSGKNRANMLCHLFVAAEKPDNMDLYDYLVEYPYHTHIKADLEPVECVGIQTEKEKYFNQLLEKYSFDSEKMAVLIWRLYQKLFDKLTKVPMVFSRECHPDRQKDGEMARELTWLMYHLSPEKEFREKHWYDKLTYGVHTEANTKDISLYYTDENVWNNAFYIDEENDVETEAVPPVFIKMGELACSSEEKSGLSALETFVDSLREDSQQKLLSYEQMDFLYERWKIKNGYQVEESYIKKHLDELLEQAHDSFWHKEYLYEALSMVDSSNRVFLRNLWLKMIYEQRSDFPVMKQEEKNLYQNLAFSLLHKMQEVNQQDFATALHSLPKESLKDVLERYMEEDAGFILEELDQMSDLESLKTAALKYGSLSSKFTVIADKIIAFAKKCYEAGTREERENLSDFMDDKISNLSLKDKWQVYQNLWLSTRDTDILSFLAKQKGRIEGRHAGETYEYLVAYAEKLDSKNERIQELLDMEEEFRKEYRDVIADESILQMEDIKRNWTIAREVNRLKQADLKTLFEKTLKELGYEECYKQWFRRAVEILGDFRTRLEKEDFVQLLEYRTEGWLILEQDKTEEWKEFDKQLKKQLSKYYADFSWRVLYYTSEPADQVNETWSYINLDYDSFCSCSRTFESYPEKADLLRKATGYKRESYKKAYLLWEKVKRGTRLYYDSLDDIADDQIRPLMAILEKTLIEKEDYMPVDLMNLCLFLHFRFNREERTYKVLYRKAAQYERFYQNKDLCCLLKERQMVLQVKMNLKVPHGRILDEMVIFLEKYELENENRKEFRFYKTASFLKEIKKRFDKEEIEKVFGINDMIRQLEKVFYDTEIGLKQSQRRKGDCMSSLERLEMEKARLMKQLEECEHSIREKRSELERKIREEQEARQEYVRQCEALSREPKAELLKSEEIRVQKLMAEEPVQEPVAQPPVQEPVAQPPVQEPVAQPPVQEPVAQPPAQEPVAEKSAKPDFSEYYIYGADIV